MEKAITFCLAVLKNSIYIQSHYSQRNIKSEYSLVSTNKPDRSMAAPGGGKAGSCPSFRNLGKVTIFGAVTKNIWAKPKFFRKRYEKFG